MIELQVFRRVECHDGEPVGALEAQALQAADQAADPVEVFGIGGGEPGRCVGGAWSVRVAGDGGQQQPVVDELLHTIGRSPPADGTLGASMVTCVLSRTVRTR